LSCGRQPGGDVSEAVAGYNYVCVIAPFALSGTARLQLPDGAGIYESLSKEEHDAIEIMLERKIDAKREQLAGTKWRPALHAFWSVLRAE
jgi:hypothetical protein